MTVQLAEQLPVANSVLGIVTPIIQGIAVLMLAFVGRLVMRLVRITDRLTQAVFPEDEPSLPTKVNQIRTDVAVIKARGTQRSPEAPDNPPL